MEIQTQESGRRPAPQQAYEPPQATFVPLKLEERLLACVKTMGEVCPFAVTTSS
jgi:hypothetical protein